MKEMNEDMKRRGQKNIQNKATNKTNFYITTKHAMIHLKYCYGSILFVK